ncbi:Anillin [Merluccius polli]|uniref:Anillin n=1 Tax=Merluccius polli TaxID=89951 RepID=A0AA47MWZ3_MERPO|nr:Anillin [Merluccius polli]
MDPFTEKLLERTRARKENLQRIKAERATAANRQMTKRAREPLAETNSILTEPVLDKALHPSSKPSPSKRRCSEENAQPSSTVVGDEEVENRERVVVPPPALQDPPTDKKPPAGPTSIRSAASLERKAAPAPSSTSTPTISAVRPTVQPIQPEPVTSPPAEPEAMVIASAPAAAPAASRSQAAREGPEEAPAEAASGMRSRLQRLAAQRNYWDNDTSDDVPLSPVKRQPEVAPTPTPSEAPMGRKGRLANLAATISSWEDDLSHATFPKDNPPAKPPSTFMSKMTPKQSAVPSSQMANTKPLLSSAQNVQSPVKSTKVVPASPQKANVPTVTPAASPAVLSSLGASPQKGLNRGTTSQSPLKSQGLSRCLDVANASPSKPDLPMKPARLDLSVPSRERVGVVAKDSSTPQQQKATSGTPGVKSFLERFGERCQERQGTPTGTGGTQAKNPSVTPLLTPNTRLVQEKLRAAQATTTTSDLTQRQKLERETELAKIRSRFQKADNMWKNKDEAADAKKNTDAKAPAKQPTECVISKSQLKDEVPVVCIGLAVSSPVSTSSPLRVERSALVVDRQTQEEEEEKSGEELEMNTDSASINSAVINELFKGVLEQSDDANTSTSHGEEDEDEEEEDALNISSMSILTPLAETVASVIRSPERRVMMTSTPASSFQRARFTRTSTDSLEDDHKLPYSVDAYRSIRVKETERPHVNQVIVRKEDVSLRTAVAPGSSSQDVGIKQRMKALTSDMNMQQTVVSQASQALNCCTDEEHGKGSPVEAEAQRLLLVATEKRLALKAELERMKGEGPSGQRKGATGPSKAPKDMGVPASKGSITLQELRLPLKADFVCAAANKPESSSHYFFIMIRAGAENMVATPLVSTRSGLSGDALSFKTKFTMSDVSNDFEVDIQVYCLVMKREVANDKKKKSSKSKIIWRQVHEAHDLCMSAITPKRFLAITKSSQTPVMASPGGPNAVRTSNFVLVGSHKLTLSSIGKNKFPLEKVPFLCPLEGHIYLKMQCQVGSSRVEEKGFLTMFEDVSGFGAWHRRWCVLSGYCISYWTYPDDERRKNPIGRINLANCTSRRVEPANREFCARPHTLELITVRPQRDDDRETLVSQCQNTMCVTKNWLSADTKDERNLWMQKLNQILVDLRMWQPDSCLTPP